VLSIGPIPSLDSGQHLFTLLDESRRIFLLMQFLLYSKQAGTFKLMESQVFSPKNTLWQGLEESPFFFLLPLPATVCTKKLAHSVGYSSITKQRTI
jgi:hypothetical protein